MKVGKKVALKVGKKVALKVGKKVALKVVVLAAKLESSNLDQRE